MTSYGPEDNGWNEKNGIDGNSQSEKSNMAGLSPEFPTVLLDERILLTSESLGPINGVSRTTTSLILSLQQQPVSMKLVAPHYIDSKSTSPLAIGPVRRLGGLPLPYTPELTVAYPFRLDRICANFKPTIMYLASPASVGFQVMLQLRCMSNPPIVMANFQTDLSAYSSIILPAPLDRYSKWLLQMVEGYLYSFDAVHTVFYPSLPVFQYLAASGVPKAKLVHLGRGVDTRLFQPTHRDEAWRQQLASNAEIILVCVGRLAPEKGFPFLAAVAVRLAALHVPFKLLVIGGNKNTAVEDAVRSSFGPVSDRVVFTGFLEGPRLARAYASADVFVHCSVTETFGLVVLEAMASGLPIVARDAGGPSEIVQDAVSGYLTAPDSLTDFVARVRELASDTALRSRMAARARAQAEDSTWEKINLRVAARMAEAVEERKRLPARGTADLGSQALNWMAAGGLAIWTELWFTGAVVVISVFWMIAVVPLLVHGNVVFSGSGKGKGKGSIMGAVLGR
jgi:glycosyltransferase involved in cell wall biosynthesis